MLKFDAQHRSPVYTPTVHNGVPTSNVRPRKIDRRSACSIGPLHDGIVDSDLGCATECMAKGGRRPRNMATLDRSPDRLQNGRLKASDLLDQQIGARDEVVAVPELAARDIFSGDLGCGLLDEGLNRGHACTGLLRARDVSECRD